MTDIFISYSQRDRGRVEALASRLRDVGFDVWFDGAPAQRREFRRGHRRAAARSGHRPGGVDAGGHPERVGAIRSRDGAQGWAARRLLPRAHGAVTAVQPRARRKTSRTGAARTIIVAGRVCWPSCACAPGRGELRQWGQLIQSDDEAGLRQWVATAPAGPLRAATRFHLANSRPSPPSHRHDRLAGRMACGYWWVPPPCCCSAPAAGYLLRGGADGADPVPVKTATPATDEARPKLAAGVEHRLEIQPGGTMDLDAGKATDRIDEGSDFLITETYTGSESWFVESIADRATITGDAAGTPTPRDLRQGQLRHALLLRRSRRVQLLPHLRRPRGRAATAVRPPGLRRRVDQLPLLGLIRGAHHQIFTRFSGARYILSPSFTSKAV